ncbi:MAG: FliM/FliN family flagellar motor switch protein [Bryobacteraceae bacterium]
MAESLKEIDTGGAAELPASGAGPPPPRPPRRGDPQPDAPTLGNRYADLPLGIEVELDRKKMTVRDILRLKPGSVLRMTRSAGENIDIRVGGALMGFGEIVILEERMGVRITDFHEGD